MAGAKEAAQCQTSRAAEIRPPKVLMREDSPFGPSGNREVGPCVERTSYDLAPHGLFLF